MDDKAQHTARLSEELGQLRVVLIDDHKGIGTAVGAALANAEGFAQPSCFVNVDAALASAEIREANVVLLDAVFHADRNVRGRVRRIREAFPDVPVLMFSAFDDRALIHDALAAGARGFVHKAADWECLVDAIRRTAQGESVVALPDAGTTYALDDGSEVTLSASERAVMRYVCEGLSTKDIATRLMLRPSTVKTHLGSVRRKLNVSERDEIVAWAAARRGEF